MCSLCMMDSSSLSHSLTPSLSYFLPLPPSLSPSFPPPPSPPYFLPLPPSLPLSRRLLPVQTNSPDRVEGNIHDPVFCSQFTNSTAQLGQFLGVGVDSISRFTINGSISANLANGTTLNICPPAGFRAAPPCVCFSHRLVSYCFRELAACRYSMWFIRY